MTSTLRTRLPAPERRSTILAAAGRLFGGRGYEGTTLDDVAAAAGVTKPIVYRHFGSKEALYLALLEQHRADLPSLTDAIPPTGTGAATLGEVLAVWLDYFESHSYAWKMLFRDTGGGREIERFRQEVQARAREVLASTISAYSEVAIPANELEPLAELMRTGMASLVLWWLEHPSTPRTAIVEALMRVWTGILGGASQAATT